MTEAERIRSAVRTTRRSQSGVVYTSDVVHIAWQDPVTLLAITNCNRRLKNYTSGRRVILDGGARQCRRCFREGAPKWTRAAE